MSLYLAMTIISILVCLSSVFVISVQDGREDPPIRFRRPRSKDEMIPPASIAALMIISVIPVLNVLPIVLALLVLVFQVPAYLGRLFFSFASKVLRFEESLDEETR